MNTDKEAYIEWFQQSDYDLDTAENMFDSERFIYCVFMCHLSIEKVLKGLIVRKENIYPPKTHNLIFLVDRVGLSLEVQMEEFVTMLNTVSIPTRYPKNLQKLISEFSEKKTKYILTTTKALQTWIKNQ